MRHLYYKNDLTGALPLHQLESLAIGYESYQLAYTPQLITHIYGDKVIDLLLTEGKFMHNEGDANWWIRSGTKQFIEGIETDIAAKTDSIPPFLIRIHLVLKLKLPIIHTIIYLLNHLKML